MLQYLPIGLHERPLADESAQFATEFSANRFPFDAAHHTAERAAQRPAFSFSVEAAKHAAVIIAKHAAQLATEFAAFYTTEFTTVSAAVFAALGAAK